MSVKPQRAPLARPSILLLAALVVGAALIFTFTTGSNDERPTLTVAPDSTATAVEAAIAAPKKLWEAVQVRAGDTLARILTTRGQTSLVVHQIVESGPAGRELANLHAGDTIKVATDEQGALHEIAYSPDPYRLVSVRRLEDGSFESNIEQKTAITANKYAEGKVEDSLFAAGKRAGVSDTVILELADVFGYDVDFALEVQRGDSFRVLYEEILVDGERVRDGKILAAEFINNGTVYQAIDYATANGREGYYRPDGQAMRRAFLRTPVDFARISSRFSTGRMHPVLHLMRAHKGVDYAAARGTPVRATADGSVQFSGNQGGYGRVIILRHGNQQSTVYAHLERFAQNIRSGGRVKQGQIIGYVGSSGLASGPHLHYEFRINGQHKDPLKVKTTPADPIPAAEMAAFLSEAGKRVAMLDSYASNTAVARNDHKSATSADL